MRRGCCSAELCASPCLQRAASDAQRAVAPALRAKLFRPGTSVSMYGPRGHRSRTGCARRRATRLLSLLTCLLHREGAVGGVGGAACAHAWHWQGVAGGAALPWWPRRAVCCRQARRFFLLLTCLLNCDCALVLPLFICQMCGESAMHAVLLHPASPSCAAVHVGAP